MGIYRQMEEKSLRIKSFMQPEKQVFERKLSAFKMPGLPERTKGSDPNSGGIAK